MGQELRRRIECISRRVKPRRRKGRMTHSRTEARWLNGQRSWRVPLKKFLPHAVDFPCVCISLRERQQLSLAGNEKGHPRVHLCHDSAGDRASRLVQRTDERTSRLKILAPPVFPLFHAKLNALATFPMRALPRTV